MAKPRKGVNRTLAPCQQQDKNYGFMRLFAAAQCAQRKLGMKCLTNDFFKLDILINIKKTPGNILDRCSVICDSDLQL